MKPCRLNTGSLAAALVAALGCDRYDERPRGAGASGRPLAVLAKPQIDMERFFKYPPEQEKVIAAMHRPFDEVVRPGSAGDAASKALMDQLKARWDDYRFVHPKEGLTKRYRAVVTTTSGDLVIDFFEGFSPDVVRNFIARLAARAYAGQSFRLEQGDLVLGPPAGKEAYTLPARPLPAPRPKGAVYAFLSGDRSTGERFGISLRHVPGGGAGVTMFGRLANPSMDAVLGTFAQALKTTPGSVVVRDVKIETFDRPVFEGAEVRLPKLGRNGELEIPDMPLYTGATNAEVHPRDQAGSATKRDAAGDSPIQPPALPSTMPPNPNAPNPSKQDSPKRP